MKTLSEIQFGIKYPTNAQRNLMSRINNLKCQDEETIEQGNHELHTREIFELEEKLKECRDGNILICCQHELTEMQKNDLGGLKPRYLKEENTSLFEKLCSLNGSENLHKLASELISEANMFDYVLLPIGSPAFMFQVAELFGKKKECLIFKPMFSHSERKSIETVNEDGTVTKSSVFEHIKYITI